MKLPHGWPTVGWVALALVAMLVMILAMTGTGEHGLQVVVRATARTSVALFMVAFVASSLYRTWPTRTSHWILVNRRQLGVSFAVSHLVHLAAVLSLLSVPGWSLQRLLHHLAGRGGNVPELLIAVLGGLGVVVLVAMTATSFDRTADWLGPRRWKRLHTFGVYYLWFLFFAAFGRRALLDPFYRPIALALAAALVFRLAGPTLAHPVIGAAPASRS